jgi:hypothetical protein
MGPKGSFEPPVSEPKLKVEPIKPLLLLLLLLLNLEY